MKADLKKQLPKEFGLAFDGWSEFGIHYVAVFAIGPGVPNNGCALLGFSPFEQEDDLSAAQHAVYLKSLLPYYACSLDDIL